MKKLAVVLDQDGTLTPSDTIFDFYAAFGKRELGERICEWSRNAPERVEKEFGVPRSEVYPSIDVELIAREIFAEQKTVGKRVFEEIGASAPLFKGVKEFVGVLREIGAAFFIVTATYEPISIRFAERLKIPARNVFATKLALNTSGDAIGFRGPVMESGKKAVVVRAISRKTRIPLRNFVGVGDASSDLPFLKTISDGGGLAIKLNGKPCFKKITKTVIEFAETR